MRIGIFGGSFDPIHWGHLRVVRAAADRLRLDRVLFVPARQQPFKTGVHAAGPEERGEMVRLALGVDPRFAVDLRELQREGPSYTVDTLRELHAEYPEDELFLLVGADAARDLPEWREAPAVARLAHVVVLTRPGVESPSHELIGQMLEVPPVDISATDVRERVRQGRSIRHLVPPAVTEYVAARGLYRSLAGGRAAARNADHEPKDTDA